MNITITRNAKGLKLYSYNPRFREYINTHRNGLIMYNTNNFSTADCIYCYDYSLFELMCRLGNYFNNVVDEPLSFDVEL